MPEEVVPGKHITAQYRHNIIIEPLFSPGTGSVIVETAREVKFHFEERIFSANNDGRLFHYSAVS